MATTRVFNGKRFTLVYITKSKLDANIKAREERKRWKGVRITESKTLKAYGKRHREKKGLTYYKIWVR